MSSYRGASIPSAVRVAGGERDTAAAAAAAAVQGRHRVSVVGTRGAGAGGGSIEGNGTAGLLPWKKERFRFVGLSFPGNIFYAVSGR